MKLKPVKLKTLLSFKTKLIKPYNKLKTIFIFKFHRPFCMRRPRFRRRRFRTKVVRFRKPFSVRFPRHRPKTNIRLRKPTWGKKLRFRRRRPRTKPNGDRFGERIAELLSVFRSMKRSKELEQAMESVSDIGHGKEPFPSPITPAFVRHSAVSNKESSDDLEEEEEEEEEEEVCRSFESCLVEMIVEEGKIRDLKDVEELLYCWKNLKCPVFIELVGRFYGEICKDLFCPADEDETNTSD